MRVISRLVLAIAIAAVALVAAWVLLPWGNPRLDYPSGETRDRISTVAALLEKWHARHGNYPGELSALAELLPTDLPDGYKARVFVDGWDRAFAYKVSVPGERCAFQLYSLGANGLDDAGAKDDIVTGTDGRRPGC